MVAVIRFTSCILLFCVTYDCTAQSPTINLFQNLQIPWDPSAITDEKCRSDVEYWMTSLNTFIGSIALNCSDDEECMKMKATNIQANIFAVKQIDSFGKIPANVLEPNVVWQGSYDECVAINDIRDYRAKFCWSYIALNPSLLRGTLDDHEINCTSTKLFLRWSICMPKSCDDQNITALLNTLNNSTNNALKFCDVVCRPPDPPPKDAYFWIVIGYCIVAIILVLIASVVDYVVDNTSNDAVKRWKIHWGTGVKTLLAFSIYTNGAEVLNKTKKPGQINCLHCMRTVSMTWVVISHIIADYNGADNPTTAVKMTRYFLNDAFANGFPSVDTFFFIGGILIGYLFFKQMGRNRKLLRDPAYWILYYVHRILRLSPPYYLFIGFYVVLYPYYTRGPRIVSDVENCKKYWWRSILYIQNFFDSSQMCLGHTWYLSADMFHYIFAPVLLVPLCLSITAGSIIALLLLGMTIAATYGSYEKYKFPPTLLVSVLRGYDEDTTSKFYRYIYTAPWVRCSPVVIGILTGYLINKMQNRRVRLHPALIIISWTSAAALGVACVYSLHGALRDKLLSTTQAASYYAWHRIGWALSLAWVTIACQFNMAGPVKNFMELDFWMPLSRLSYCAYLVHRPFIDVVMSRETTPLHFTSITDSYIHEGIPVIIISFLFAFVWSCGFEIPFGKLEKMVTSTLTTTVKQEGKQHIAANGVPNNRWAVTLNDNTDSPMKL